MNANPSERTHVSDTGSVYTVNVSGATCDLRIVLPSDGHPKLLVTDGDRERAFDLSDVTTDSHDYLSEDGLDTDDPDVKVHSGEHIDDVLIRGVAEHMVGIGYGPSDEATPRVLFWTEYHSEDDEPRSVPL